MYMYDEIYEQPSAVRRALSEGDAAARALAKRCSGIRGVVIAARGSSDNCARYARYLLEMTLGLPVSLAACSVLTLYGTRPDYRDSLVIGISQSGQALDVCEVLRCAAAQGAVTAAFTADTSSPLAKAAEFCFDLCTGREHSVAATKTVSSQMALASLVAARLSDNAELSAQLALLPDALSAQLTHEKEIDAPASAFAGVKECFVLSRGLCYPVALEAALKLKETCYINAQGYSSADFMHGPLAVVEKGTPVLLFSPQDEAAKDVAAMRERLSALGASLTVFGKDETVPVAGEGRFITPVTALAAAQLFACLLSQRLGLSADNPRTIRKITVTR